MLKGQFKMLLLLIFLLIKVFFCEIQGIQNITVCGNLTCLNNATDCTGGNLCLCRRGFKGERCQSDFNECEFGDPCYHRGHCQNTYGSWSCDCLQGWRNSGLDQHCDEKTSENIDFRKCIPGWSGEMCLEQCFTSAQCGQNQVCKKRGREMRCLCVDGWQGTDCTTDADECTKHPCKNFQVCLNTVGSYACECPAGWKGSDCSEDIDECTGNPCNNSGTCTNTDGSYSCSCTAGWKGTNCEEDVDECLTQPCNSSLTCHNTAGTYTCDVKPTLDKVDTGILKTSIILVAILGSLLLLIIIIIIVVATKDKCRKNDDEEDRGSTPVIPIPDRNPDISVMGHTGSAMYQENKHGLSSQHDNVPALVKRDNHHVPRIHSTAMYKQDNHEVSALHPYGYASFQHNRTVEQRQTLDF